MRKCDGCTKCCEGWLHGVAHDKHFWPGTPCHFMGEKGCTIYEDRPHDPCKTYRCHWLDNQDIPEWLKPNRSNIIITKRQHDDISYLDVTEAGSKMTVETLTWLMVYCLNKNINIKYNIGAGYYRFGDPKFSNSNI